MLPRHDAYSWIPYGLGPMVWPVLRASRQNRLRYSSESKPITVSSNHAKKFRFRSENGRSHSLTAVSNTPRRSRCLLVALSMAP